MKLFYHNVAKLGRNPLIYTMQNSLCKNKRSTSSKSPPDHSFWKRPPGKDTGIKIYNPILKRKVPLILKNDIATWYSCGPTVYDSAHIGHASCYVKLDIIQRILTDYFDIKLITCTGVTDIDDKIIKKSQETGQDCRAITQTYESEFWKNLSDLGVAAPDIITRVTDHIPTISDFIKKLLEEGVCYWTTDGSIFFDTESYGRYGKFQNAQEHDEDSKGDKKSPADFALWKAHKDGEPYWEIDGRKGRPGWHIECSAMVSRLFGDCVDFHAGGIDLRFPHHENEDAQSCAFHRTEQWVNYWIHTGHLHLKDDVKMSKSLKNTISINELLRDHSAETFRMVCLLSHYRNSMEFNEENVRNAESVLSKIRFFLKDSNMYINDNFRRGASFDQVLHDKLVETERAVDEALRNDFETAKCVLLLLNLITETRRSLPPNAPTIFDPLTVASIVKYVVSMMNRLGIRSDSVGSLNKSDDISRTIDAAVEFRQKVRARATETKDKILFDECDTLRNRLAASKIKIRDVSKTESNWVYDE